MSKITKKGLAILIITVLLSSLMPNLVSFAVEPVFTINNNTTSTAAVNIGEIVDVSVDMTGLPEGMKQLSLGIQFDPNYVEPVYTDDQIEDACVYWSSISNILSSGANLGQWEMSTDKIAIGVASLDVTKLATSGNIAKLQFKLLKNPGVNGSKIQVINVKYSDGKADSEETEIADAGCSLTIKANIPMTDLNVEYYSGSLFVGETCKMNVSKLPAETTDEGIITYSTDNEAVATVDNNGIVTAKSSAQAFGWVRIYAQCTSDNGTEYKKECGVIKVLTPLTSVTLNKTNLELHRGTDETAQLTATPNDLVSGTVAYTWTSSDENIATVDENGKVTAVGNGQATITVTGTTTINNRTFTETATCQVTVDTPLSGLKLINPESGNIYIEVGNTTPVFMEVEKIPGDTDNASPIIFSSSDENVAMVNEKTGEITAVNHGTATITAICEGYQVSCTVEVIVHINSIKIVSGDFELKVAQDPKTLEIEFDPEDFSDSGAITWKIESSNPKIADGRDVVTMKDGVVTAVNPGTVVIKAILTSNTEIFDTITITVPEIKATELILNTPDIKVEKYADEPTILTASLVSPDDEVTTDKVDDMNLTWVSSDESIVKIEKGENGVATIVPITSGTAIISATVDGLPAAECEVTVVCSLEEIKVTTEDGEETVLIEMSNTEESKTKNLKVIKTPEDADADVAKVKWSSELPEIATVDENGKITAVAPGRTYICAELEGKTDKIEVVVEALLTDIEIKNAETSLEVYKNKQGELEVVYTPENATIIPEAEWEVTSGEDCLEVVSYDEATRTLIVKGLKEGTAEVTVSYKVDENTTLTASRKIEVKEVKATGVTVTVKPETVLKNEEKTLEIEISKAEGELEEVTDEVIWSSDNEAVAYVKVENGEYKIVGLSAGTANITVTVGDYSDTFEIAVEEIHISSIKAEVSGGNTLTEGSSSKINITVNPSNTTDSKVFSYTVSNPSVAKVIFDGNGIAYVKGVNAGTTTVVVTAENGVKTSFEVTVEKAATNATESSSNGGADPVSAGVAQVVNGLVSSPHTGDMNIVALAIMAVISLIGMVITIKKK